MVIENMSKNLRIRTKALGVWSPDKLHLTVAHSLIFVGVIETGKEPSIETHFGEETSIGVGVTEWINLPSDSGFDSKLIKDPLMPNNVIIDHVFISGASLIVHRPSSIDKLKLTIGNELLDLGLHVVFLVGPPHREEFHLNFGELSFRIIREAVHNSGKFHTNVGHLGLFITSIVVLINGLKPSDVIMRMRHNVDVDWLTGSVMFYIRVKLMMVVLTVVSSNSSTCDAQKSR